MRVARGIGGVLLGLLGVLSATPTAHAWTRAVVHSARATVDIEEEATVYVLLRLDVEVHAGWLHELELVDLGPGVELDRYRPPYFRSEEGEVRRPEAELDEDGRIRLSFERREAPRRGEYKVFIRYRTPADVSAVEVDGERRPRVVWSLPAWETGLHGASVEIRAPKGSVVPMELRDPPPGTSFEVVDAPRKTVVRWRRVHLPRLTDWPLEVDLPPGSIALPSQASDRPTVLGFRPLPLEHGEGLAWPLLLIAALVLLKRRFIEARFGRAHLVLAFGWPYVLAGAVLLLLGAQILAPTEPLWAIPLLLLLWHRAPEAAMTVPPISPATMGAGASERPNAMDVLDATTPVGASFAAFLGTALLGLDEPSAALLLAPVFLLGTRLHRPPSHGESARILLDFVARLRVPAEAPPMSLRWDRGEEGSPCVHLVLPDARVGTRGLRFVVASSRCGEARKRDVMLLVETRAQSDADDLMRRRTSGSTRPVCVAGSNLRLVAWDAEAFELLRALASQRPSPAKPSRGTWFLRELTEPRRRAA